MNDRVRIDRWLWAVRLAPTRQIAADMCRSGKVLISGGRVKPSRQISTGETIVIRGRGLDRSYMVKVCIEKRVGAVIASDYKSELTPEEDIREYCAIKEANRPVGIRPRGTGRPTKKDRRKMKDIIADKR